MNLDAVDFSNYQYFVALPDGSRVSAQSGWMRVKHIVGQLTETPRIAAVRSIVSVNRDAKPWEQIGALPSQFVDTFVSTDRTKALVVVIPRADAQTFELSQLVRDIRANYARPSDSGSSVAVGGLPALNADYEDSVRGRFVTVARGYNRDVWNTRTGISKPSARTKGNRIKRGFSWRGIRRARTRIPGWNRRRLAWAYRSDWRRLSVPLIVSVSCPSIS